jgi:hypothetical protein
MICSNLPTNEQLIDELIFDCPDGRTAEYIEELEEQINEELSGGN